MSCKELSFNKMSFKSSSAKRFSQENLQRLMGRVAIGVGGVFLLCCLGCNLDGMVRPWSQGPREAAQRPNRSNETAVDLVTVDAQEVDLVEEVIAHRRRYIDSLKTLKRFYAENGHAVKDSWAAFELVGLKRVKKFRYLMDAEVPTNALRGTESIAEADELLDKGRALMRKGGHGILLVYRQELMIEAAQVFRDLIETYPSSDKIDDAAFYCGEIHKEYMSGQEFIAVKWYERAWTWNPETPHPARFQAAVTYDYRLHDRDRALELYHAVINHETAILSNVRFAMRRIHELTADDRSARADASRGR